MPTRSAPLFRGLADDQVAVIVDRQASFPCFVDNARVPVDLPGVRSADDRDQGRIRIIAGVAETAVNPNRDIDDIARVERDLAFAVTFEPVDLPPSLKGQKDLVGRVAMQRCPTPIA